VCVCACVCECVCVYACVRLCVCARVCVRAFHAPSRPVAREGRKRESLNPRGLRLSPGRVGTCLHGALPARHLPASPCRHPRRRRCESYAIARDRHQRSVDEVGGAPGGRHCQQPAAAAMPQRAKPQGAPMAPAQGARWWCTPVWVGWSIRAGPVSSQRPHPRPPRRRATRACSRSSATCTPRGSRAASPTRGRCTMWCVCCAGGRGHAGVHVGACGRVSRIKGQHGAARQPLSLHTSLPARHLLSPLHPSLLQQMHAPMPAAPAPRNAPRCAPAQGDRNPTHLFDGAVAWAQRTAMFLPTRTSAKNVLNPSHQRASYARPGRPARLAAPAFPLFRGGSLAACRP